VARRISGATLGLTALASFLLPGPTSAIAVAAAAPREAVDLPAPRVGPERPVSDPGPLAPRRTEGPPAVAAGDSVSLAAWPDSIEHIRVARISDDGDVLDPIGIELDPGEWGQSPTVAFDGTNFLVVWISNDGLTARRVSPDGDVLDASNIVVSPPPVSSQELALDFDGTNYLVAWVKYSGRNGDIYGRRVSPAGTVVDAGDLAISTATADQRDVALAFNGTNHLLAWTNAGTDVHGTLVSATGVATNPAGVPISNAADVQSGPAVTSVGTSFFVAWADSRNGGDISGTRVTSAGVVSDPSGIAISAAPSAEYSVTLSSDGSAVLAAWTNGSLGEATTARFTRIDAAGTVLDPTGPALPTLRSQAQVVFDGQNYLAVGSGDFSAQGVRVAPDGDVLDPDGILVSAAHSSQNDVDQAFDGTNSFVVWLDNRLGWDRIYGGRLAPDGEILDGAGIAISGSADGPGTPPHGDASPAVAFDGTNHLVVWVEFADGDSTVKGARVSAAGEASEPFVIASDPTFSFGGPTVAFGGGSFLVAWSTYDPSGQSGVDATRVSSAGAVLDPVAITVRAPALSINVDPPAVAYGSSGFLVAWSESQAATGPDVFARRVSTAGALVDPAAVAISTAPKPQREVDVASHDGNFLVVWSDERHGITDEFGVAAPDIYGARLDGSGTVLDPAGIPISTDPAGQGNPSVAANGRFLVTWNDPRRNLGTDIFGTRIEPGGTVESPNGQVIAPDAYNAVVAPAPGTGRFSVAYPRYDEGRNNYRAYVRTVAPK